jgi:O-antigen/teichoic acid export membrane protein
MTAAGRSAGERAIRNVAVRATGEIVGKAASFVVFAVLARKTGPAHVGTYVFALAWGEVAMGPVGLGIDRYLLRRAARDRASIDDLFFNALALKLVRGLAILALTIAVAFIVDFSGERRVAVCLITAGMLADTLARSHMSVFNAYERGDLVAIAIVVQRCLAAALGLAFLLAGYGVAAVALAFLVGALARLAVSFWLLGRRLRMPAFAFRREARRELRSKSLPFTAQDIFGLVISRADILLLAALASSAAVGLYGSAYRLLDATTFIAISLNGAFTAPFTYLGAETTPTLRAMFERANKLALLALLPVAAALGVLAEPIVKALFGADLAGAATPLRYLAPVVAMFGVVGLCSSLIMSRRDPRAMLPIVAASAVANLGLNLALVPSLEGKGAAIAMLASETVFLVPTVVLASRTVGAVDWPATVLAPLGATVAMSGVMLALQDSLVLALAAGALAFAAVYALLERVVRPADLDFAVSLVRRRLPAR